MTDLVYVAQRFGTWQTLHRSLPLTITSGCEWGLNMYGVLEATLPHGLASGIAEDGHPLIEEGGTIINAETGNGVDRRRWQGIVHEVTPDGPNLKFTVRELAGYPDGLTFTGNIHGVKVDPAAVVRDLWAYTQAAPSGDFGVSVVGSTPLREGTDSDIKSTAAKIAVDKAKAALELRSKPRKAKEAQIRKIREQYAPLLRPLTRARDDATQAYDALVQAKAPKAQLDTAKAQVTTKQEALKKKRDERDKKIEPLQTQLEDLRDEETPWQEPYDDAEEAYRAAQELARKDGGGLKIEAADFPDTWDEITKLAKQYGFDFTTRAVWSEGKPDYRIQIAYPSAGRTRDDLTFQQGINIISELKPRSIPYASEILGRGAGEGDGAIRANSARVDRRARRNIVLSRPEISTVSAMRAEVATELKYAGGFLEIPSITVRDNPAAPLWSWNPGDTILVQGIVPNVGRIAWWHRILSWKLRSPIEAELRLERVNAI
ncbi:hypothetical protein G7068_11990 [Leucobacter viscericola]|uniref:Uncharacterized protein n=1 Tax=Leucobacter viscericola TaxID=2714935 RepID=A0A6G7XGV1_9MICO|nr:hypothetical protein [Leucobacter viscericola]QIK63830.1 hypothetical protein G7068_11990 [Leucobacter viscericola]